MTDDDEMCPTGNAIAGIGCGLVLSVPLWIMIGLVVRFVKELL